MKSVVAHVLLLHAESGMLMELGLFKLVGLMLTYMAMVLTYMALVMVDSR